jgi:hypothetical protein
VDNFTSLKKIYWRIAKEEEGKEQESHRDPFL